MDGGKKYLIGLDLGTSSIKGVLIDAEGRIIVSGEIATSFIPMNDRRVVEYDGGRHYRDICSLIRKLCDKIHDKTLVKGLSMAAASGNTLLVDKEGEPLSNVISWMDRRILPGSSPTLRKLHREDVHDVVGWPALDSFPLAHLAWFKENMKEVYGKTVHYCMNSDFLCFKLTGKWMMDHSTATTFYLQNQLERSWHEPFLEILEIDESALSRLCPSGTMVGNLTGQAAEDCGLSSGTTVFSGAFDHPCAARGSGVLNVGDLLLSCGTSWVAFYPVNDRGNAIRQKMLVDPFLSPAGPWGAMSSLPCIGIGIDELVKKVIVPGDAPDADKYAEFNRLAVSSPIGANGLFINPMKLDEHKDMIRIHSKNHISRALMEGAVFSLRRKIEELAGGGIKAHRAILAGGISKSPEWVQIIADVTGLEVSLDNCQYTGAYGAALLAGTGIGLFRNETDAFSKNPHKGRLFMPDPDLKSKYDSLYHDFCLKQ